MNTMFDDEEYSDYRFENAPEPPACQCPICGSSAYDLGANVIDCPNCGKYDLFLDEAVK
jgi:hypothetical protein